MRNGVLLGLTAALFWGVGDFCARGASRAGGTLRTLLLMNLIASVALGAIAGPLGLLRFTHPSLAALGAAAVVNLAILGGAVLLYRAFIFGTLALVSPIAASFAALTALLAILSGEHPSATQLAGIVVTVAGVTLTCTVPGHPTAVAATKRAKGLFGLQPGVFEAIAAMLIFGVSYWLLRFLVARLGGVQTAFIGKVADLVVLSLVAGGALLASRLRSPDKPLRVLPASLPATRGLLLFAGANAVLDTGANIAYNLGIAGALTSVVAVLSSLFSAVTVLLASVFLRDRLSRWQWVGVVAILAGVALVSV
ncbi:MAG: EamA family transporter [Ktedonobacterales bacterium]